MTEREDQDCEQELWTSNTEELFKNNKDLDGTMSERMFGTRVPYSCTR
jgi:hypothetical protein